MVWQEDSRVIVMTTNEVERGRVRIVTVWKSVVLNMFYSMGTFVMVGGHRISAIDPDR